MIETNRLKIYPASKEQMVSFIEEQTDDILITAYNEMLDGSIKHPNEWGWYAIWMIELKDGTHIGDLCFKGINENGSVEIGYGINEEYQGLGYATEAVIKLTNWALEQSRVTSVIAEVEETNIASQRVLIKSGFVLTNQKGEEGSIYVNSSLFNNFKNICLHLNEIGIIPTLMGSLGLEFVSKVSWNPKDIDIHVPGNPKGWDAPDELRIYNFNQIMLVMNNLGYKLVDKHEHEFKKDRVSVEFGSIDSLYDFAGIREEDIEIKELDNIKFRIPNLNQFLFIYEASSKDSYRNDKNNNKDFIKIEWIKKHL